MTLKVIGDKPAYQVSIEAPDHEEYITYEDNFFWMEPGETRTIAIRIDTPLDTIYVSAWNTARKIVQLNP